MGIPSKEDISPTGGLDLDELSAVNDLHGNPDISVFFDDYSLTMCFHLKNMGPRAFEYYIDYAIEYFSSHRSDEDSPAVHAIIGACERQMIAASESSETKILTLLRVVIERWDNFDFKEGDECLFSKVVELIERIGGEM